MKIPTISLKKSLKATMNNTAKRLEELEGLNKKALIEEYSEWIESTGGSKYNPYVLYLNQINVEQL